jgi:hypothetical protein
LSTKTQSTLNSPQIGLDNGVHFHVRVDFIGDTESVHITEEYDIERLEKVVLDHEIG